MSRPFWFDRAEIIHRAVVSKMKGVEPFGNDDATFLAVGLFGEAGEVAAEFEKVMTGHIFLVGEFVKVVEKELADVRILFELFCRCHDIELAEPEIKGIGAQRENPITLAMRFVARTGLVANEVKKWLRGDRAQHEFRANMKKELGEMLLALSLLADSYDIRFDKVVPAKLDEVEERFRQRGILPSAPRPVTLPEEVTKLIERVRLSIPSVEVKNDPFIVGGYTIDFYWTDRYVNVEWRPTDEAKGWSANRYGVSLVKEDSMFDPGPDEWITGREEAAVHIAKLLAK